jgi:hypothetical protein
MRVFKAVTSSVVLEAGEMRTLFARVEAREEVSFMSCCSESSSFDV